MRALGAVLIAIAVAVLVAVLVYLLTVVPGQREPLNAATFSPASLPPMTPVDTFPPPGAPTPSPRVTPVTFSQLAVGTCLNDAHTRVQEGGPIDQLEAVPCDGPHYEEVISLGTFADGPYPGAEPLIDQLDVACPAAFASYVGIDYGSSVLSLDYLLPTQTSWLAGDRGYACLVFADTPLEHSVEGSAR